MKAEGAALVALASSVADGDRIDWVEAEASAADSEERELIRRLRVIAAIGEVHRSVDAADEEPRGKVVGRIQPTGSASSEAAAAASGGGAGAASAAASMRRLSASEGAVAAPATSDAVPVFPPEALPLSHWGHLELRERVGAGVFGEVYRAFDPTLQREVAVKLLKKGSRSADLLASKVLNEGRLLARIRHPNVVTVYGVATHDDRVGLWMELVRGCTLEELLDRQGPFSGREAALIGQDLCRALAAVHGASLLHRDVKAQNVIREERGRVVLMDFGTGLLVENEESVRSAAVAGTPLYLAPEILNGHDAAPVSDVYSLGVLLFHLVTGTYPYAVPSLAALREAQRKKDRKRLQDLRPDLPEAFVQVVDRATEADPAARYPSAGAFQQALSSALGVDTVGSSTGNLSVPAALPAADVPPARRVGVTRRTVLAAIAALAVAAVAGWAALTRFTAPPLVPVDSVVVLPFANLGRENEDLAQGIQLLINDRLEALENLRVVRYTPEMQTRDRGLAVGDVIARHAVGAAIDGTVIWTGSDAKVSVRLIRAGSSTPAWVRQFERPSRRAVELPRDVAREIARALAIRLSAADDARLAEADSASPNVFEAYLRGRAQMRLLTDRSNTQAIVYFLDALKLDPNHAPSLAAIAECYLRDAVSYRVRPVPEAATLARQAAQQAIAIDPGLAAAHNTYAQVKFYADWDTSGADEAYRRAVELSPNSPDIRQNYAMFLVSRRRLPDAMQQMQSAVALDPSSAQAQAALGMLWHYARSNDQAERVFRGVIESDPASVAARFGLVRTLLTVGRYGEALSHIEELRRLTNDRLTPSHIAAMGLADVGLGRTEEARKIAERLVQEDNADGPSIDAASVFAALGDRDRALEILEHAVDQRAPRVLFLRMDPRFDALRGEARFERLVERLERAE